MKNKLTWVISLIFFVWLFSSLYDSYNRTFDDVNTKRIEMLLSSYPEFSSKQIDGTYMMYSVDDYNELETSLNEMLVKIDGHTHFDHYVTSIKYVLYKLKNKSYERDPMLYDPLYDSSIYTNQTEEYLTSLILHLNFGMNNLRSGNEIELQKLAIDLKSLKGMIKTDNRHIEKELLILIDDFLYNIENGYYETLGLKHSKDPLAMLNYVYGVDRAMLDAYYIKATNELNLYTIELMNNSIGMATGDVVKYNELKNKCYDSDLWYHEASAMISLVKTLGVDNKILTIEESMEIAHGPMLENDNVYSGIMVYPPSKLTDNKPYVAIGNVYNSKNCMYTLNNTKLLMVHEVLGHGTQSLRSNTNKQYFHESRLTTEGFSLLVEDIANEDGFFETRSEEIEFILWKMKILTNYMMVYDIFTSDGRVDVSDLVYYYTVDVAKQTAEKAFVNYDRVYSHPYYMMSYYIGYIQTKSLYSKLMKQGYSEREALHIISSNSSLLPKDIKGG